ncbi:PREDICTED: tetratricopeptide repeat protein 29-like, partial [Galeopterus variegatus]|uniref:Tetratricopeptide repeat protein 29 n=1 Tax=Galeopterus variegatus TaxID=482537 RepID=A0ABM0S7M9_GALVR
MTTLPPLSMTYPKLTALARQKLPCSPRKIPRSQLIKEKDDIDHYLEANFKGLSKEEVAAYRNSYKKNICVDMLRDGYHKSFTELFGLMERWDALREAARVRSVVWLQKPLEEQPDKLDCFYHYLTRAEAAERKEYLEDVYNNLYALACYFNNSEDKWVRNHFYERCFKVAQLIKIDGGKKEAEACAHMGLLYEEDGQLLEAAEHYEAFHQLTQGRIWKDEAGRFLNLLACESLLRTYRLLSDKMLENKEYKQAIKILIKASEIAKEGNDKKMEGEASYYLGLAQLAAGEYETALTKSFTVFHGVSLFNSKANMYAKVLKIRSSLWFIFMNGFYPSGQLLEAAEHYEAFHQLTQGRIWKDETGRFLNLLACESLLRTYRLLSDKMLENKEYKQAIKILIKASEIAKEAPLSTSNAPYPALSFRQRNDKKMEGEASYYLGLAQLAAGEYETALTYKSLNLRSSSEDR